MSKKTSESIDEALTQLPGWLQLERLEQTDGSMWLADLRASKGDWFRGTAPTPAGAIRDAAKRARKTGNKDWMARLEKGIARAAARARLAA